MNIGTLARTALACALLALPASALAATFPPLDLTAFTNACRAHGGIQSMVSSQPPGETLAVDRLCTCIAGRLDDVSQNDAGILTKDLLGTATEAERTAYANYAELNARASSALDSCMVSEGFRPGVAAAPEPVPAPEPVAAAPVEQVAAPTPPVAPVPAVKTPEPPAETVASAPATAPIPAPEPDRLSSEASGFLNACVTSSQFVGFLEEAQQGAGADQGTICSCLTGNLVTKVSAADMTVLAADFASANTEVRPPDPAANYAEIAELALTGLRTCMSEAGVTPNF